MLRIVVILLLTTGTLLLLSAILTGVDVTSFWSALGSAALIGLVNALVWPLVIRFALPLTVLTLGLGVVVLNGAMVLLVAAIDPGLTVDSLFGGIVVALCVTVVNTAGPPIPPPPGTIPPPELGTGSVAVPSYYVSVQVTSTPPEGGTPVTVSQATYVSPN